MTSCEPAGLELACILNNIRHIIVCGHSDCKAMNLLYQLKSKDESNLVSRYLIITKYRFKKTKAYISCRL